MTPDEIVNLVALSLRKSALPSVNGIHQPDRYQASVTAEDMGHTLARAGLVATWHEFYARAMPPQETGETWNTYATLGAQPGPPPPR